MIPFGPWHPDRAAINTNVCREAVNVLPAVSGFRPFGALVPTSPALEGPCRGASVAIAGNGVTHSFAGTETKLYKLGVTQTWDDVSRIAGGPYAVGTGERWSFSMFGDLVLAGSVGSAVQKYNVTSSTDFSDLGGSPPQCRYLEVVRDFVFVGGIPGNERRVQWSGVGNAEFWTPGSQSSDFQDAKAGGPVRGIIGGETGYVFQAASVTRFTYAPGSPTIFQVDEVEGGRGLRAPHSLVRLGRLAWYLSNDGFYRFDATSGASVPIGVNKWARFFADDVKPGTESLVIGGIDPSQKLLMFSYIPRTSSSSSLPSRLIVYDWTLEEATIADVSIYAMAQWLTQGVTLDTMNQFGTVDALPFSLDSPVWRGGAGLMGAFGPDNRLAFFSGQPMAARIVTADGATAGRQIITGVRPAIDSATTTAAIAMRERDGDPVTLGAFEAMEDTGVCPQHASGNLVRCELRVAENATWTLAKGLETIHSTLGSR